MRSRQLHDALEKLIKAIREWKPLSKPCGMSTTRWRPTSSFHAANIGTQHDTKGGKRREMNAWPSFNTACELGFRGSLDEWEHNPRVQFGDGSARLTKFTRAKIIAASI